MSPAKLPLALGSIDRSFSFVSTRQFSDPNLTLLTDWLDWETLPFTTVALSPAQLVAAVDDTVVSIARHQIDAIALF